MTQIAPKCPITLNAFLVHVFNVLMCLSIHRVQRQNTKPLIMVLIEKSQLFSLLNFSLYEKNVPELSGLLIKIQFQMKFEVL